MSLINEGLPQKGIVTSEIQSEIEDGYIKITMRTIKPRNRNPLEHQMYFTLNGLNILIGNLQAHALWMEEHGN